MTILTATNLGHSFGAQDLFSGISLTLDRRDRIGLVGPNGVGKTTLLQILAGLLEPRQGEVRLIQALEVGYLRQEAVLTFRGQSNSVFDEMLTVFDDLRQQEARLRELEQRMADGASDPELFEEYGELQQLYEHGGGYAYQHEIKRVLTGLGFPEESWQTPLTHLSGGQKTRVLLGRMLLEEPELLILDEPTNHLDMAAVEWLEQTLSRWSGALIIVSHDRYFLDRVVNGIWAMEPGRMRTYKGNYSSYVAQRQQQWEREKALFEREKARLEEEVDFIKRNIAGGNSDMARGRLRRLTRDVVLLEEHGVMAIQGKQWMEIGERVRTFSPNEAVKRVRGLQGPGDRPVQLNIRLQPEERSARTVLRTRDLRVGYDETLFTSDDIKLERYDCVALIGPNGSGKSTMLRTLLGEVEPMGGGYFLGDNLQPGYFAQAHEQLTPERSVLDELLEAVPMSQQDARSHLAHYLFRGDDVFKKVRDLSGGERGRLALAILALSGANFLLLDEPTNHLDIPAQEVLQEVLEHFEGTIILVTHDRYLVDRLATQIWHLEDGHLHVFHGTYQEHLEARARAEEEAKKAALEAERPAEPEEPLPVKVPEEGVIPEWVTDLAPPPKLNRKGRRKRESRMSELQLQMEDLEVVLDQLRDELTVARATGQEDVIPQLEEELVEAEREMLAMEEEWNALEGGWVS